MKNNLRIINLLLFLSLFLSACDMQAQKKDEKGRKTNDKDMKLNELTAEEKAVIISKGTEIPFIGVYNNHWKTGTYNCKQCDAPLYNSTDKFDGHCGWPSFDDEIKNAVKRIPDRDGRRVEIVCANCGGHLGHVFEGEGFTDKNTRHCVNSISLTFKPLELKKDTKKVAYFAGGCFWGMEYHFAKAKGVTQCEVGYMGGKIQNPTYQQICTGTTGHYEAIKVVYNSEITDFETLARLFFEIHDPTQTDGQGPDIGEQYLSVAFYGSEDEKQILLKLIALLEAKGYDIATGLLPVVTFWNAEEYHQRYYQKKGQKPYCHSYTKRF